jgi:hypothetical protein
MSATAAHATRVSAGGYPRIHEYGRTSPPPTPLTQALSATLVNARHNTVTERPSIKLKIPGGSSDIFNSTILDAAGQSLYSISSTSKRTMLFSCKNNVEVATVDWDRSSPRMVFHRKKWKCKEWLPLAGPETEYMPTPATAYIHSGSDCHPLGLAHLHMVKHNLLGCIGPPQAMCVSAPTLVPLQVLMVYHS